MQYSKKNLLLSQYFPKLSERKPFLGWFFERKYAILHIVGIMDAGRAAAKAERNREMKELIARYPSLSECAAAIESGRELLIDGFKRGGKLLVCGNGGSCADSEHIVGELMKAFLCKREIPTVFREKLREVADCDAEALANNLQGALPAISLTAHSALNSAYANDKRPDMAYAQQVYGYGRPGDVFLGISTSGNSANVVYAAQTAKAMGLKVMVLAGKNPCRLDAIADVAVHVPEAETYKAQELHMPIYHYWCAACEEAFFGGI